MQLLQPLEQLQPLKLFKSPAILHAYNLMLTTDIIVGLYARIDLMRGIMNKAPAKGYEASDPVLSDQKWKYLNVRRLFIFLRESIISNFLCSKLDDNRKELG